MNKLGLYGYDYLDCYWTEEKDGLFLSLLRYSKNIASVHFCNKVISEYTLDKYTLIESYPNSAYDELKNIGTEQAWLKIQEIDTSACIHRSLALEGAIHGIKKTALPQERRVELKDFYNWHKGK